MSLDNASQLNMQSLLIFMETLGNIGVLLHINYTANAHLEQGVFKLSV